MAAAISTLSLTPQSKTLSSTTHILSQPKPHSISLFSIKPKTTLISTNSRKHNYSLLCKLNRNNSNHTSENNPQLHLSNKEDQVDNIGVKAALAMLKFYKREISPLLPRSCRYVPTCSEYSMQAYKKYGVVKGTVLTGWRICRCNPLGGSGFDPPRWFGEKAPSIEELEDDSF